MLKRVLPNWLVGLLVCALLAFNTVLWGAVVFILGVIKLIIPHRAVSAILHQAYQGWRLGNRLGIHLGCEKVEVHFNQAINDKAWYLLISNHLSWLDIVVLSAVTELPPPKFFLKDELKWVPFIGSGAWALGMPFMKRASKEQIAKNPKLKGMDVARTKRSCSQFKQQPSCIVNFVEGSRCTLAKQKRQQSPFKYLLKPKAGGIAFALQVLGEQFDALLDTSIVYDSTSEHICRDFCLGRLHSIDVFVDVKAMQQAWVGDYQNDKDFRIAFQQQLNQLWLEKDSVIEQCVTANKLVHAQALEQGNGV